MCVVVYLHVGGWGIFAGGCNESWSGIRGLGHAVKGELWSQSSISWIIINISADKILKPHLYLVTLVHIVSVKSSNICRFIFSRKTVHSIASCLFGLGKRSISMRFNCTVNLTIEFDGQAII